MNILLTVDFYEPSVGGTQKVVKIIAERLAKNGHTVSVATSKLNERKTKVIAGVKIYEFDIKGNKISGIQGEDRERYEQLLIGGGFDIIFNYAAQQWTSDIMFDCLDKIKAKKIIVTCGFSALNTWYARRYFRQMPYWLSKYDRVICTSKEYQDYTFCERHGIENMVVVPNGALASEFRYAPRKNRRKEIGIPSDHTLLTLIGTHTAQKGHAEAIEIFKKLDKKHATLLIIGNQLGQGCYQTCLKQARQFNQSEKAITDDKNIVLADLPRSQTIGILRQSDLFLFPSQIECSPLVIYESMAAGIPFASTKVGNVKEIVEKTQSGWLLPTRIKNNKASVLISQAVDQVNTILANQNELKKRGQLGRKMWIKAYTFEKITDRYEQILKQVVKQQKVRKIKRLARLSVKYGIDVVIPTYNTGTYLADAITSVLTQSWKINQLLVVDDGSTDNTRQIVKKFQKKFNNVKYIYQKNKGLSHARNTGIKASEAEYIGLLDADDIWQKDKIKLQMKKFQSSDVKNIGVVYCEYDDIDVAGKKLKSQGGFRLNKKAKGQILKYLLEHNYATGSGSGVVAKRLCFEKAGLFDDELKACEDWDMWIRIAEAGFGFDYVNKKLVFLRRRPHSMQSDIKHMLINSIRFFNKYTLKGYKIPAYHQKYLQNNIFQLMFQGPKNLGFLYALRSTMNNAVASVVWPSKKDSLKAISWVFYTKANQIWAKVKKII